MASPSAYEAFGITTLEAWSLRKASRRRRLAVADVHRRARRVRVIVPHGDTQPLVDALATLGREPSRRAAMGAAGHERLMMRYRRRDLDALHAQLLADAARAGREAQSAHPRRGRKSRSTRRN
jgi:hypothetical protein